MYPHFSTTDPAPVFRVHRTTNGRSVIRKFLILTTRNPLKSLYERLRPRRPPNHVGCCLFTGTHDTAAIGVTGAIQRKRKSPRRVLTCGAPGGGDRVIGPPRTGTSGLPCWLKCLSTPRTHLTVRAIIPLSNFLLSLLCKQLSLLKLAPFKVKGIDCPLMVYFQTSKSFASSSRGKTLWIG